MRHAGFDQPTPIQKEAIPPALEGRDILASAETGSGKTAAFLLPIMNRLLPMQRGATRALVLAPTRELAAQIVEHFRLLAQGTSLTCAAVHGGVAMGAQERAFRKGVDALVACPGRLLDHMRNSYAELSSIELLVIDEADRMLDMGFLPDVRRVLAGVPKNRQTYFFSATLPPAIVELSREMLHDPARLTSTGNRLLPAASRTPCSRFLPRARRSSSSSCWAERFPAASWCSHAPSTGRTGWRISSTRTAFPAPGFHGNRSQSQRTAALAGFKQGRFQVLVATDIAARGIDVEALGSVVNFDVPNQPEDYIHRVGRTARAKLTGDAYTLVSPEEEKNLSAIERALGRRLPRQKVEGFDYSQAPVPLRAPPGCRRRAESTPPAPGAADSRLLYSSPL